MVQARHGPRFATEPPQITPIGQRPRQNFDCTDAVYPSVPSAVHISHPARTNRREDSVRPRRGPG